MPAWSPFSTQGTLPGKCDLLSAAESGCPHKGQGPGGVRGVPGWPKAQDRAGVSFLTPAPLGSSEGRWQRCGLGHPLGTSQGPPSLLGAEGCVKADLGYIGAPGPFIPRPCQRGQPAAEGNQT